MVKNELSASLYFIYCKYKAEKYFLFSSQKILFRATLFLFFILVHKFYSILNIESNIRLFADNCVIYRQILRNEDMAKLQSDVDRLGKWAVENAMKINPSKSKAVCFTRTRVKGPLK